LVKNVSKPPSVRFLFSHPAHLIACGFGSGLSPFAPGTFGTLFGWATFQLLVPLSQVQLAVFLGFCFIGGCFAAHKTGADLGVIDHGSIVWDEIVPFWMVLALCPRDWRWQLAAFLLFRFYDIVKPQPARYFDRQVKNGFGVMTDDLVAAVYTALTLQLFRYLIT